MAGLVPAIHRGALLAWMAGANPAMMILIGGSAFPVSTILG
jgi:hypothetical protein